MFFSPSSSNLEKARKTNRIWFQTHWLFSAGPVEFLTDSSVGRQFPEPRAEPREEMVLPHSCSASWQLCGPAGQSLVEEPSTRSFKMVHETSLPYSSWALGVLCSLHAFPHTSNTLLGSSWLSLL